MSDCEAQGRALKGRVSLLWRVTEQSDGPQRAQNNSYFLCTPRRQDWSAPYTSPPLPIKPLFLPAFISERQTVSGVHFSIFLCINYLFFWLFCVRVHTYTFIFLYSPLPWFHALAFLMYIHYSVTLAHLSPKQVRLYNGRHQLLLTWCRLLLCR